MTRGSAIGILICAVSGVLLPARAVGQPASLVADLRTTSLVPIPDTRGFHYLQKAGDRLYFGGGGSTGDELWVSDGTSTGTEVVRDLCPGPCSTAPELFGALGKLMLWSDGTGLWRSDGTRPGTFALTGPGLKLAPRSERFSLYAILGRWFYFSACTGYFTEQDCDLWRTDGTVAGTGIFHKVSKTFRWFQVVGDRLYFLAGDEQIQGSDLWVTDGTPDGTALLRRFEGAQPEVPAAAGNRLIFTAWESSDGRQVWTSEGTAAGTRPVTAFPQDRPYSSHELRWFKPVGDRVYFLADDGSHGLEIWRSDGTSTGTARMTELAPAIPFPGDEPSILAELGGVVVFVTRGEDPAQPRLWMTRGTPVSTTPLSCEDCQRSFPGRLTESGGKVFFLVQQDFNPRIDLWITDGTSSGTRRLKTLCYSCSSGLLVPWKGGVLFSNTYHIEDLWISDGTTAGTRPFTNFPGTETYATSSAVAEIGGDVYLLAGGELPGLWIQERQGKTRPVFILPATGPSSYPRNLEESEGKLLFVAQGDQAAGLWSSGGTQESTVPISVLGLNWSVMLDSVHAAGVAFFMAQDIPGKWGLWRTDGTAQGTVMLLHLPDASATLVPFQGALYVFSRREIWRSNGTVAGTIKTGDLPEDIFQVDSASAGANGIYLKTQPALSQGTDYWITDGSTAGTHRFFTGPGGGKEPLFTAVGPWMYFVYRGLWRTDGTPGGTTVVEVDGAPLGGELVKLVAHQGALYFVTLWPVGFRLWRTDDTTADLIAQFPLQATYELLSGPTPSGGRLFFSVDDGVHGVELWSTDGTPAGTALVSDLFPGPRSSNPTHLTAAGEKLFFTAGEDLHGIELWQSDGTAAGTRLVQDIAPQADSSNPEQLTPVGDKLFFTADDGITGREVWVLPLSGPSACQPSPTRLCLGGGRYAVEAVWRDFQGNQGVGRAAPLTADTGTFWFFDPANVEVVLKVLDGRGLNDHVWVFYGALSNVEYTLTVTDTQTGLSHRYLNPSGQLASVADIKAFGPLGATTEASVASASPLPRVERRGVRRVARTTAACAPSSTRLCLNQDRFAVEISWKDFEGKTGVGKAVEMTGDTGYFWFFNESNVEVVLKVLDGTPVNGHHWVFYGALSSVEYTVTVTDTQTGEVNTYKNPSGRLASVADTGAF